MTTHKTCCCLKQNNCQYQFSVLVHQTENVLITFIKLKVNGKPVGKCLHLSTHGCMCTCIGRTHMHLCIHCHILMDVGQPKNIMPLAPSILGGGIKTVACRHIQKYKFEMQLQHADEHAYKIFCRGKITTYHQCNIAYLKNSIKMTQLTKK